jgi:hypothetical protein
VNQCFAGDWASGDELVVRGITLSLKVIRHDAIPSMLLASAPVTHGVHVRLFSRPR